MLWNFRAYASIFNQPQGYRAPNIRGAFISQAWKDRVLRKLPLEVPTVSDTDAPAADG